LFIQQQVETAFFQEPVEKFIVHKPVETLIEKTVEIHSGEI
jgi:hypothetical protein